MALSDSALEEMTRPKGMEGQKTIAELLAAGEAYKDTGARYGGTAQRTIAPAFRGAPEDVQSNPFRVPESSDYSGGTAQRGVAKPADIVRSGVNKTIDVLGLDKVSQNAADMLNPGSVYSRPGSTRGFSGLGAMQEKDYSSMLSPEQMGAIENGVKNAILQSDELSPEEKQQAVGSMSGSNALEFIEQILTEASKIPDEEVSSMPLEVEEEAEGYIDEILGTGAMDSFAPAPEDVQSKLFHVPESPDYANVAPAGMNYGGPVQSYNRGGLASMGRMEDTELAHVAPGERIVPEWILGDKGEDMLDASFIRAGIDPVEYTVGSGQGSINPRTGMPEYTSFFKRLLKKVKKVAPIIGGVIGFSMGGNIGAGIGKAIGGVIKTGDLDFQNALTDFGTGWAMGNFATGMGMQGNRGVGSIFKPAAQGGMWGWGSTPNIQHTIAQGETPQSVADKYGISEQELIEANPTSTGRAGSILEIPKLESSVGGFIQQSGAKLAGALGGQGAIDPKTKNPYEFGLVEQFKNLPMGKKLGVGALGLAALSQTGMFDKEQRGEIPENITQGMQGLENYVNEPLRAYNPQPVWGQNAPLIDIPQTQSAVSPFMTTRAPSLSETLSELANNKIGLDFPSFNAG